MSTFSGKASLRPSAVRTVYLVTYSQANLELFPNRNDFVTAVVESFESGPAKVQQWCCSRESHADGGKHYHMAVKLKKCQRWLQSRRFLEEKYGINVNFSSVHHNYYSAWQYVTKDDDRFEESEGHPDLRNYHRPRTSNASVRSVENGKKRTSEAKTSKKKRTKKEKAKRLTAFDVSEVILKNNIKNITQLHACAQQQRDNGKTDLCEFILCKAPRAIKDIIDTTWHMKGAREQLERAKMSRTQLCEKGLMQLCEKGRRQDCACVKAHDFNRYFKIVRNGNTYRKHRWS